MIKQWVCRGLFLGVVASSFAPLDVHAKGSESQNVAAAQVLYEEATRLMDRKKYADACPKLEQVTELLPKQPAPHDTLGECYKALGRFGSAWEQFTVAQSLSRAKADTSRIAQLVKKAKDLEPKVAKIKIVVRKAMVSTEGLSISRDGIAQETALWNSPMPVDTGDHLIEVIAPGREKWSKRVTVLADGAQLEVEIPALMALKEIPKPPPPRPLVVVQRRTWQKPLGWTSLAIGGASVATSGILSALAVNKRNASNADGHCNEHNFCDTVGMPLRDQAMGLSNVATATMIFGGVLAAGGLVVVLTTPRTEDDGTTNKKLTKMRWNVEVSPVNVGVRGVW